MQKKAHIPVILVNNGVDTDDSSLYSCMLGSDYGKQMKKAGKWLDEYLKEEEEKKAEKEKAASEARLRKNRNRRTVKIRK